MSNKKIALITGGSSGIGQAIGEKLFRENYIVLIADINAPEGKGGFTEYLLCDITKAADIERLFAQVLTNYGIPDVLISNAGQGIHEKITEGDPEKWARVIDINLVGALRFVRAFIQDMIKNDTGSVVFVSSTSARQAYEYGGIYAASKAALNMVAKTLQLEVAGKIRVTVISPGVVDTGFFNHIISGHHTVADIGWGSVAPQQVADLVYHALSLPPDVNLSDITITPTPQRN